MRYKRKWVQTEERWQRPALEVSGFLRCFTPSCLLGIMLLFDSHSLECGQDLQLASNQQHAPKVLSYNLFDILQKSITLLQPLVSVPNCSDEESCHVVRWYMNIWGGPQGLWPTASTVEALSSTTYKELNPANNHGSLEVDLSPLELPDQGPCLADTLTAVLCRIQLVYLWPTKTGKL